MEMKPEKRYQTPAEMVVELKAATQRLSINSTHEAPDKEGSSVSPAKGRADGSLEGLSRSVMIVESNPSMQDMFRDRLKKHGYRVLVISDAGRALDRLDSTCHVRLTALYLAPEDLDVWRLMLTTSC